MRVARGVWRVLLVPLLLLAACGQPEMQPLSLDAVPWRAALRPSSGRGRSATGERAGRSPS